MGQPNQAIQASDEFKRQLSAAFDALSEGQVFTYRRTFTDGDVALFCGVTGDLNPYHQDEVFARASFFGRRIVPGLLTASMATHIGGLLGFLATRMTFEYTAGVYVGDTITCTVTIASKDEASRTVVGVVRCVNQDGQDVLRGQFSGFPSNIRLAR